MFGFLIIVLSSSLPFACVGGQGLVFCDRKGFQLSTIDIHDCELALGQFCYDGQSIHDDKLTDSRSCNSCEMNFMSEHERQISIPAPIVQFVLQSILKTCGNHSGYIHIDQDPLQSSGTLLIGVRNGSGTKCLKSSASEAEEEPDSAKIPEEAAKEAPKKPEKTEEAPAEDSQKTPEKTPENTPPEIEKTPEKTHPKTPWKIPEETSPSPPSTPPRPKPKPFPIPGTGFRLFVPNGDHRPHIVSNPLISVSPEFETIKTSQLSPPNSGFDFGLPSFTPNKGMSNPELSLTPEATNPDPFSKFKPGVASVSSSPITQSTPNLAAVSSVTTNTGLSLSRPTRNFSSAPASL